MKSGAGLKLLLEPKSCAVSPHGYGIRINKRCAVPRLLGSFPLCARASDWVDAWCLERLSVQMDTRHEVIRRPVSWRRECSGGRNVEFLSGAGIGRPSAFMPHLELVFCSVRPVGGAPRDPS